MPFENHGLTPVAIVVSPLRGYGKYDPDHAQNCGTMHDVGGQIIETDVAVVGGGNAALCAALMARESGASVTVLECAPAEYRGGNSRHTRNMRCMHEAPTDVLTDAYTEDEYFDDLRRVTEGNTAECLAKLVIRDSRHASEWMKSYGVRFQPSLGGTLHLELVVCRGAETWHSDPLQRRSNRFAHP